MSGQTDDPDPADPIVDPPTGGVPVTGHYCNAPHPDYPGVRCGLLVDDATRTVHSMGETRHWDGSEYYWPGTSPDSTSI